MGRQPPPCDTPITHARVQRYLQRRGHPNATVIDMTPLGQEAQEGLKDYGYGCPIRVRFISDGAQRDVVLRTMSPDPFGHDRRADRIGNLILSYDTFDTIPRHIQPLDVGVFDDTGELLSLPAGEGFLVTEYVEGELYASDLHAMANRHTATPRDLDRARALALTLAELHRLPTEHTAETYRRSVRDTLGAGEGIFGLCDSYPPDHPVATAARLEAIEHAALAWRWRLRAFEHRVRRTHGDFHPFNILFREGTDFTVLDCSRGALGEPADDVTCLSINYLFFALTTQEHFDGALRAAWDAFWNTYLGATNDEDMLRVVAPFFAWRGLVVASPLWYPQVPNTVRDRLMRMIERLLDGASFHPADIEGLLS